MRWSGFWFEFRLMGVVFSQYKSHIERHGPFTLKRLMHLSFLVRKASILSACTRLGSAFSRSRSGR